MKCVCYVCIGGTRVEEDMRNLRGVNVIVGTPGRVLDMMQRKAFSTEHIQLFVLDEADEMLSRGFSEQIRLIYNFLPETCQVIV